MNSRLRDRDLGLPVLAYSLAMHERVSHGCPRARAHASLEGLREIVGRRDWGAHLRHRVVARSGREARGLGQVEIAWSGQGRGRKAGGVGCGGHGEVTVRRRGRGADGLRARVRALGAQVKAQG